MTCKHDFGASNKKWALSCVNCGKTELEIAESRILDLEKAVDAVLDSAEPDGAKKTTYGVVFIPVKETALLALAAAKEGK